jgi:hypothetical protein
MRTTLKKQLNPNSIKAAKANAKRFWTDPVLAAKNIANRKASKLFKETHNGKHFQTKEMREKCTAAKQKSEKHKASAKQNAKLFQRPEVRERARQSLKESPLAAEAFKKMRKALAQSKKCQKGIKHHAGRNWSIRSPSNVSYKFVNLSEFIRNNAHLFHPDDIPVKALRGIGMLRPSETRKRISGTWKGWTWISHIESIYNDKKDLLNRQTKV